MLDVREKLEMVIIMLPWFLFLGAIIYHSLEKSHWQQKMKELKSNGRIR